jgi:DNA-directed RNA polymerase specialized sigma24 family protein
MALLEVVPGLTYTHGSQVFERWLMPVYKAGFRWTGNRADTQDLTAWVFSSVAEHIQVPESVCLVDDGVRELTAKAVARHWRDRYRLNHVGWADVSATEARLPFDALTYGLTAEMRLLVVLRFLRRKSPAAIGAQLRISPGDARRRTLAALARVAQRIGLDPGSSEFRQGPQLSDYVEDLVARRRPLRFEVDPEAWPVMMAAGHLQAAIVGNDLPVKGFIRTLERQLDERAQTGFVTASRIWCA